MGHRRVWRGAVAGAVLAALPAVAHAAPVASCGGVAMLGGAYMACTHTDPAAPVQACTFSWTLMTTGGSPQVVGGAFELPPGASNALVYQGSGFSNALSPPIVLCGSGAHS
ncbi:MAG: hypothetical protein INR70_30590 [Parafilimonas terrae]|nr:hypothetical protein [Parafilimonas terrae]